MGRGQANRQVLPLQASAQLRTPFDPFEIEDFLLVDARTLVGCLYQAGQLPRYDTNHVAVLSYMLTTQSGLLENHVRTSLAEEGHATLSGYLASIDRGEYDLSVNEKTLLGAKLAMIEQVTTHYELLRRVQAAKEKYEQRLLGKDPLSVPQTTATS